MKRQYVTDVMVFWHEPTEEDKDLFVEVSVEVSGEEKKYLYFEINKVNVIH